MASDLTTLVRAVSGSVDLIDRCANREVELPAGEALFINAVDKRSDDVGFGG